MINVQKLVPEIYRESRDFKVFLKLLSLVVNVSHYEISEWTTLYDPMKCPDDFLPLLAELIGYRYDTSLSVTENRVIMSEFNSMIKNKGSIIGLRQAAAISMNAQLVSDPSSAEYIRAVSQLEFLEFFYDYETGIIQIFYPEDLSKIRDVFKYVRPVGTFLELVKTNLPEPTSDVAVSARATVTKRKFTDATYMDNSVNQLQINLGQINRGDSTDTNNLGRTFNGYTPFEINGVLYSGDTLNEMKSLLLSGEFNINNIRDKQLDINCDGVLDYSDIEELRQVLLGFKKPSESNIYNNL